MSIRRYGLGQEFRGYSGLQPPLRGAPPHALRTSRRPFLTSDQGGLRAPDWLGTPSRPAGFSPVAGCDAGLPGGPMQRRGLGLWMFQLCPACPARPARPACAGRSRNQSFSNQPSPGCVPRVKPQHRTRAQWAERAGGLVHVCPDLLGSLADETRGETEQVADGKASDGGGGTLDAGSCRGTCPKGNSGRRAASCPLTGVE